MGWVLNVVNAKGGVAKTTTSYNLAAILAAKGRRVLAIDLDPQGGLSVCSGVDNTKLEQHMLHVLLGKADIHDCVVKTRLGYDLVPTNIDLVQVEWLLYEQRDSTRENDWITRLRQGISDVRDEYDYVILDNQPTLGVLAMNSIAASDKLLVPINCEYMALRGLDNLLKLIKTMASKRNASAEFMGIIVTMFDRRAKHSSETLKEIARVCKELRLPMFPQIVSRSVRYAEATMGAYSIQEFEPKLAEAYVGIANQIDRVLFGKRG